MLTEFLRKVEAHSVRDKAIELLRVGRREDFEDAWKLGAILAESGALGAGIEVLRALREALLSRGEPSTWREEITLDLGHMLLMQGDAEGNRVLERADPAAGREVGLDTQSIGVFYEWLSNEGIEGQVHPAGDEPRHLERAVDRWWQASTRRQDSEEEGKRDAATARLAADRSLRAWLRNASREGRAEYERLTQEIAALPRKVVTSSSRDGGKVSVTLGLAPEFVALQQQLADLHRSKAASPKDDRPGHRLPCAGSATDGGDGVARRSSEPLRRSGGYRICDL